MFMLVWVPLPVCQTTSGKSSRCLPSRTSSVAATITSAFVESRLSSSLLISAAAFYPITEWLMADPLSLGVLDPGSALANASVAGLWVCALIGIAVFAIPTGILGSAYVEVLDKQKRSPTSCPHCGETLD